MSDVLLDVKNITMQFGGLKAVDNLSFQIKKGQLVGLIGPNGAGKTTAFNMLTGVYKPTSGEIKLAGRSLCGLKLHEISKAGMTRTFQNIRLFKNLSVLNNVMIASNQHVSYGLWDSILQTATFRKGEDQQVQKAMDLLRIFNLDHKAQEPAHSLPYGEQRKLEIVRALATNPKIVLLDEPAAGMNHSETHSLMETIARVRKDFDLTVILIEHDMKLVMGICENIIVLNYGRKIEEGSPGKVQTSPQVIEAYLGVEEE